MAVCLKTVFSIILMLTLSFPANFVSCQCPNPGASSVVEYKGDHINISDVVACAHVNRGKSVVIVSSFNTTYFDVDYKNHNETFTNMRQPSLLIITPNLFVESPRKYFYLNGVSGAPLPKPSGQGRIEGKPGNPGGTAGSFLLAYGKSSSSVPIVELNGGFAGVGQDGQDARDGGNGTSKVIEESNCTAWEGGWTRFGIVPNYCHELRDNEGRCFTSGAGARWEIPGVEGERGEDGKDGGAGGLGGKGGVYQWANIGTHFNYSVQTGSDRGFGTAGKRGNPGKGGKTGDTIFVTVGVENSSEGRKCKILEGPILQPVEEFAKDGNVGRDGQNTMGRMEAKPRFGLEEFRPFIKSYINNCVFEATKQSNSELLKFCGDVKYHYKL